MTRAEILSVEPLTGVIDGALARRAGASFEAQELGHETGVIEKVRPPSREEQQEFHV
jgi:hypothetical protein